MNDLIRCLKCKKEYPKTDMRYQSIKNNDLICKYCNDKGKTEKATVMFQTPMPIKNEGYEVKKPKNDATKQPKEAMISYKCHNCGYAFKRKESAVVDKCPYCGKDEGLIINTAMDAESFLR